MDSIGAFLEFSSFKKDCKIPKLNQSSFPMTIRRDRALEIFFVSVGIGRHKRLRAFRRILSCLRAASIEVTHVRLGIAKTTASFQ
jgi:hypothetical protein